MEFHLSQADPGDAAELSEFAAHTFSETYSAQMSQIDLKTYIAESFNPAVQLAEIADPATIIILARDETSSGRPLIGYAQMVAHRDSVDLKRLYVEVSQKGGGLAASLMEEARKECRRLGSACLRLTVWTKNSRAIAFYKKMGFVVTGSQTFMVGEDAQIDHVMEMAVLPVPAFTSI